MSKCCRFARNVQNYFLPHFQKHVARRGASYFPKYRNKLLPSFTKLNVKRRQPAGAQMISTGEVRPDYPAWDTNGNRIDSATAGRILVLGPIKWAHQLFSGVAWMAFIALCMPLGRPKTLPVETLAAAFCLIGNFLFWFALRFTRLGSLRVCHEDRDGFAQKVTAALECTGFRPVETSESAMDFGPKRALWARRMGQSPILVDFPMEGLATINGPRGILKRLGERIQLRLPVGGIGVPSKPCKRAKL
jgi:hypothetical protein